MDGKNVQQGVPSLTSHQVEILEVLANSDVKTYRAEKDETGDALILLSLKLVGAMRRRKDGMFVTLTNRGQWLFERVPWDNRVN